MEQKSVLILGVSGFIGRNLKEYLERSTQPYRIFAPTQKEFDISNQELVDKYLKEHHFDVIIHSAIYNPRIISDGDATKELEINLRMFYNFERHQDRFGKMLYFGSGAEYDKRQSISMVAENSPGNGIPDSDYGLYKYITNKAILSSKNIINLRLFGLFGKYENWKRAFISNACCKALYDLPITIRKNVFFDYLYVDDFCKMTEWFIHNKASHCDYNLTSGKPIDLESLAKLVMKVSDKSLPLYIGEPGLAAEYTADNHRFLNEVEGFKFSPMESSVRSLYSWYQDNKEGIDLTSLLYQN